MSDDSPWKKDIPHPAFPKMGDSVRLWRYTDLAKFIWTLSNSSLYLCRADLLGDSFEGSVPFRDHNRMVKIIADVSGDYDINLSPEELERQLAPQIRRMRETFIRSSYVNCWRHGDESEAMWKLYCGPTDGIALVSSYGRLAESITDQATRLAKISYLDYGSDIIPGHDWLSPIMHKRKAFEHEQEVRLIRWKMADTVKLRESSPGFEPPSGFNMHWDIERTIDSIVVRPYAPEWYLNVVKDLTRLYAPSILKNVRWSELRSDPVY